MDGLPKQPSQFVADTLSYNEEEIAHAARISALQSMPICLSRGMPTTLEKETYFLIENIERLVQEAIDEEDFDILETVGIYLIAVHLGMSFGDEVSDKNKNRFRIEVDISIPLEPLSLLFAPQHYTKAKRIAKKRFGPDAMKETD